jgi:hypothetical protein
MGCYDLTKGYITSITGWSRKDIRTAFCSSFVAGFFMTVTVAPWDMLRTKLMNQPTDAKIYNGFVDCLTKTVKADGVLSLWRGFTPIWVGVFFLWSCLWHAMLVLLQSYFQNVSLSLLSLT